MGGTAAFYIDENGEWIAELTYIKSGDGQITIDHTEVDENSAAKASAKTWSKRPSILLVKMA